MQEDNQRPLPLGDVMETNSFHFGVLVFQGGLFLTRCAAGGEKEDQRGTTRHVPTLSKKTPETAEKEWRLLEQPEEGNGSDSLSMRLGGLGGRSAPLGLAHAFRGGSDGLSQGSILNLYAAPTEQNGAGADAA